MKGTHISRNAQRKFRNHTDLLRMNLNQLAVVVRLGQKHIFSLGHEEAFRRHRYDVERASIAHRELKRICGF